MKEKVKELSEMLGIPNDEVIEMAVEYFYNEYTANSNQEVEDIKKEYIIQSGYLRTRVNELFTKIAEGKIKPSQANDDIKALKDMIGVLKEMTKLDGDINGFVLDSKYKYDWLLKNMDMKLRLSTEKRQFEVAKHRINVDLARLGE